MQSQTKRHIRMWHSSRSRAYLAPSPVCSSDWVQMLMHWQLQVLHSQCLVLIAIKPWHTRQFIRIQSIFWAWPWHGQCFTKHKCAAVGRGSIIFNHVQSLLGFGTCTRATGILHAVQVWCRTLLLLLQASAVTSAGAKETHSI